MYSGLAAEFQVRIFQTVPADVRKVILATNVAETSLTIEGIRFVVDSGLAKCMECDVSTGVYALRRKRISRASALQRCGRAGRLSRGYCFRLYSRMTFIGMSHCMLPEIRRLSLTGTFLFLKSLGVTDFSNFDFIDSPLESAMVRALEQLYSLGAVDCGGRMTITGRIMSLFPTDPQFSKMILASERYRVSYEAVVIASMLSSGIV